METNLSFRRRGASAIEYFLLVALISGVGVISVSSQSMELERPHKYLRYSMGWDASIPAGVAAAYDTIGGADGMDPAEMATYLESASICVEDCDQYDLQSCVDNCVQGDLQCVPDCELADAQASPICTDDCDQQQAVDAIFGVYDENNDDVLDAVEYENVVIWFGGRTGGGIYGLLQAHQENTTESP
jgi:hypothetical protein